jgi:hypothetical protein
MSFYQQNESKMLRPIVGPSTQYFAAATRKKEGNLMITTLQDEKMKGYDEKGDISQH